MIAPLVLANEVDRVAALERHEILDTPPEYAFDLITYLTAHFLDTKIALVTFIDGDRQWFKSSFGLNLNKKETSKTISFCAHAPHNDDIFEITNALEDLRFKDNPLVIV